MGRTATSHAPPAGVRLSVLGPLRAWRGAEELDLGPRQQRLILALLLVQAGRPVDLSDLVDLLWAGEAPASARNVIHRYIGLLRRLLEPGRRSHPPGGGLVRHGSGYRLDADEETLDLLAARRHAAGARDHARHGAPDEAVTGYLRALELWQGRCAAGLDAVAGVHPAFVAVDHECSVLAREAADAALRCEQATRVLAPLRQAAARDPLDEALQARLLLCLTAAGRQAEALATYGEVCHRLADELGVAPGAELTAAHHKLLDNRLTTPAPPLPASPAARPTVAAQLPPDLPLFTGRRDELALLDTAWRRRGASATLVCVDGMPGIGKSTLATHWAHRMAGHFPDGQLFVDLRGFDAQGTPTDPLEALAVLLDGLGVPPDQLPRGVAARAGLYRSRLAGRRLLVLLDNAHDSEQVAPLLPATPGCTTIVTSRRRLTGLAVRGARLLTLALPTFDDARDDLRRRIGDGRATAEPAALDDIIARCARLPLALAVVGARAHGNPTFPLAAIVAELDPAADPLSALAGDDALSSVRSAFSWSYRSLTGPARRMFRLLSLPAGPDITLAAAASLTAAPPREARAVVSELTRNRLITEDAPGRLALHDLLHAYAAERAHAEEPPAERNAALDRLIAHYQVTIQLAERRLTSDQQPADTPPAEHGVTPEPIDDHQTAIQALARISSAVALQIRNPAHDRRR